MRRITAVFFPEMFVELANSDAVVITANEQTTEVTLQGNARISEVSQKARALGVEEGQTLAQARAHSADLHVRVVRPRQADALLASVAEALLAFGATVSFDAALRTAWVDVTGCAHLYDGEDSLLRAIAECVRAMGHTCRVAIADGPRVASSVARFGNRPLCIIESADTEQIVGALPVAALPLDERTIAWLFRLGLHTIADLRKVPRGPLAARLAEGVRGTACPLRVGHAKDVARLFAFIDGKDDAPLAPHVFPERPREEIEIDHGVDSLEPLLFVMKMLCDRLSARVVGRGMGVVSLDIEVLLDRGLVSPGESRERKSVLSFPLPVQKTKELFSAIRARLERDLALLLSAPAVKASLTATQLRPMDERTRHLFVPEARAELFLPALIAELSAQLPPGSVGTLTLVDTNEPGERTGLGTTGPCVVSPAERFVRILPRIAVSRSIPSSRLFRLDLVRWWSTPSEHRSRDFGTAWIDDDLLLVETGQQTYLRGLYD